MHKRDAAFTIKIDDPDSIDSSPIIKLANIDNKLLLAFKENSIYKVITADSTDPQKTEPNTGHTYEKIAMQGTASPLVARIFLQFENMIDQTNFEESKKNELHKQIWTLNEQLLVCAQFESNIRNQLEDVIRQCDLIIEQNKNSGTIPPLAKVKNLENDARSFLLVGKQYLIDCFKLIKIFTDLPITDRNEARFSAHLEWLQQNRPDLDKLTSTISFDLPWIRTLSECRNAIEHPGPGQLLTIENTKLHPGNKFSAPTWSYDLTNKLNIQESTIPIDQELAGYLNNMFTFLEDILLICLSESFQNGGMLSIYQHIETDINPSCPIKYFASLSPEFISKMKPALR